MSNNNYIDDLNNFDNFLEIKMLIYRNNYENKYLKTFE